MSRTGVGGATGVWRRRALIGVLIALGLGLSAFFGARAVQSFRQVQYIREQGFDTGSASSDAIRPWMTVRFIAVAYAVPEEYLYSQLGIAFERRNANRPLGELNRDNQLGRDADGELAIIGMVQAAIDAYYQNPVVTGLRDVRPWMSLRYIANSTGVPLDYLFAQIGIPAAGNADKPLDTLSDERGYAGGPPALVDALRSALARYGGAP